MKEVLEETGIECEPVALIAVLDGLRLGFARVPMYSLVFHCRMIGGELQGHPLETRAVGFFARDALPQPLAGAHRWLDIAFRAIDGEDAARLVRRPPRTPPWRGDESTAEVQRSSSCARSSATIETPPFACFPRVADRLVVDEAEPVGRAAELLGRRSSRARCGSRSSSCAA